MSRFVAESSNEEYHAPEIDEWSRAEEQIRGSKKPKPEAGQQEGGKSLYEVLQANKAAKQDAFEEKNKLSNQFRNLDEDEVDFLDSVMESTRAKEAHIRKETDEQVESFRKQREKADKTTRAPNADESEDTHQWAASRKRKRPDEHTAKLKLRKSSSRHGQAASEPSIQATSRETSRERASLVTEDSRGDAGLASNPAAAYQENKEAKNVPSGLVDYGSDSDDGF